MRHRLVPFAALACAFVLSAACSRATRSTASSVSGTPAARSGGWGYRWERDGMACEPLMFVDGASKGRRSRSNPEPDVDQAHARAIIYKAGREPAQYRDPQKCGALVITTR